MSIRLQNFGGLYGDNNQPFTNGFIHHELLEVRSQLYDWDIDEHLHTDLIQVFFFTSGNGVLVSELRRITLTPPCVLLIPANTLHGFAFQSNMVGEVFTIAEQSLDVFSKAMPQLFLDINQLSQYPFEGLVEEFDKLRWIKDQLVQELNEDKVEKKAQLHALLQLLLVSLYRMRQESAIAGAVSTNRTLQYFNAFQKLIRQSIHELKTIQEYAAALNITAVHLNRICQSVVKKSALQIVHDNLTNEAKKYLLNTTYSLSEISYVLSFKDPAYFSRLFKKQTGLSPGQFRRLGKM
ncbi:helix-turn-helix domain-containing protein [Spirosoma fluviale]|uniref:Transcriptional regulator, AraC family n=1 Tax=Spirosoma fluviale TaxID=1597977 RepID=A0A286FBJ6_9BACT|nr:helix-turn-helix domain-containing protein [Spirosoma fluviale]SOD80570.1 transcriptional regulator, AraC family [Spirosoma fluviale]